MAEPKTTLWPREPHTAGKHEVLREYLHAWLPIMGSWSGRILFIDGFAGPGEYSNGEPGSPLIAIDAFLRHAHRHVIKGEVVFFFIEKDRARFEHLDAVIRARYSAEERKRIRVKEGSFDETMTGVLDAVEGEGGLAPAFVMVDPFGVSGTPMNVLERILHHRRSEVYVSFMYEAINRFRATDEFTSHLDSLFGTPAWRDGLTLTDPTERKDFFYNLYDGQLRAAGAEHVIRFELYSGNRLIYAIFFGTHSLKGVDKMKQAVWKVVPAGDFEFHGIRSGQLHLEMDVPPAERFADVLHKEFRQHDWMTVDAVEVFAMSDATDYHSGHLRKALALLEKNEKLEVDSSTRKRRRTFPEGTELRFV